MTRLAWAAQILLAAFLMLAAAPKLAGAHSAVQMFGQIGAGQWLRYLVGAAELAGAIGLLIPRLAGLAAAGLAADMAGATIINIAVLHSPAVGMTIPLCIAFTLIGRARWQQIIKAAVQKISPRTGNLLDVSAGRSWIMTSNSRPLDQEPSRHADSPGDIPAGRPVSLDRLAALIGQWEVEASFEAGYFGPGSPAITSGGGRVTFEWLEGKFFLTQRFVVEHPAAPSGIAVIGLGDEPEIFAQHYYDSRGVARVHQMSLDGGIWKLWRDAPGFCQRYTGVISGDGRTIKGAWEGSADGSEWTHDFGLTYIKAG